MEVNSNVRPDLITTMLSARIEGTFRQPVCSTVEAIYSEIVASGQIRFGAAPDDAAKTTIRNVIANSVAAEEPVRILVPWGSRKPSTAHSIDIAEWMALRQIQALQVRVSAIYPPGLHIHLRIEDASGMWLFRDDASFTRIVTERYVHDFMSLIVLMNVPALEAIRESTLVTEEAFAIESNRLVPFFLQYLIDTDNVGLDGFEYLLSFKALHGEGWQGAIPLEQRDFYRHSYAKRDPNLDLLGRTIKLAEYLANSLARHRLSATGIGTHWGGRFIQLNFAQPAPGTPVGVGSNRIYYRTIPTKFCTTHIPPWRARGYVKLSNTAAIPKVTTGWAEVASNYCTAVMSPSLNITFAVES